MIETLERLLAAQNVETVWKLLTEDMEQYGFDRLLYGYTVFRTEYGLGHKDDMLVLNGHSDAYIEAFLGREMYRHAPMVVWALENTGSMSWSWIGREDVTLTPEQMKVVEFNKSHEVAAGYTISFPSTSKRDKGAIALTARPGLSQNEVEEIWAEHGRKIEVINQVAHLKLTSLPFPEMHRKLSSRQREVLEWVGDGKTVADIALIMGRTPATIEKHLKKARDVLKVETTAQAVRKASLQNQMFIVET